MYLMTARYITDSHWKLKKWGCCGYVKIFLDQPDALEQPTRQLPGEMSFQPRHDDLLCRPPTTATYGRPCGSKRLFAHPSLVPTSPQSATAPFRLAFRCRVATADQKLREIGSDFVGGVENVTCRRRKLITVRDTGGIGCGEEWNCPRGGLIVAVAHEDEAKRYLLSNGVYSTP